MLQLRNSARRLFLRELRTEGAGTEPIAPSLSSRLTHEILHVDGKIFRSVWTLLARPGVLTSDYFEGRRVRWISPIRLYLIFSLVYFAVIATEPDIRERAVRAGTYVMGVVLVPVFAWLTQLVARSPLKFPQHIVFALHVHAAWFAAFALMEFSRILLAEIVNSTRPMDCRHIRERVPDPGVSQSVWPECG